MEIHFKIIGILLILLAAIHIFFPRYFNWKKEFRPLSLINKQMAQVHTFFVALIVLLMGVLCLADSVPLQETPLGRHICLGFGIFWLIRLFVQVFVYSTRLWKGKLFETAIHALFILLWTYFSLVFFRSSGFLYL